MTINTAQQTAWLVVVTASVHVSHLLVCLLLLLCVSCVFAELLLGAPLFPGESGVGQLIEIIKVLGSPTKEEVLAMKSVTDQIHSAADARRGRTRVQR